MFRSVEGNNSHSVAFVNKPIIPKWQLLELLSYRKLQNNMVTFTLVRISFSYLTSKVQLIKAVRTVRNSSKSKANINLVNIQT